ncbi:DUF6894 family protein [Bradyrhizobium sp. S3.14.4]
MRYYFDIQDDFVAVSDSEGTEYGSLEVATREAIAAVTSIGPGRVHVQGGAGDVDREERRQALV